MRVTAQFLYMKNPHSLWRRRWNTSCIYNDEYTHHLILDPFISDHRLSLLRYGHHFVLNVDVDDSIRKIKRENNCIFSLWNISFCWLARSHLQSLPITVTDSSQVGESNFCLFLIGLSAFIWGPYLVHFLTLKGHVCQDDWQASGPVWKSNDSQQLSLQLSSGIV